MKKLILIGLIAIGVGAAGASAQAGGFRVVVNPFPLPFFLPPPPIFAPAVVFSAGCAHPVVVHGGDRGVYYHGDRYGWYGRHDGFDRRGFDHRDAHYRHDR